MNNNTNTTQTTTVTGNWVNINDNSDYLTISDTTFDTNGNQRYSIKYYKYPTTSYGKVVLASELTNAPGFDSQSNIQGNCMNHYLLYTQGVLKRNNYDCISGALLNTVTYNK
jgi:hypothetical protein